MLAIIALPVAPLLAIDGSEFSCFVISPGIPDVNVLFLKHLLVGRTADEPQQFFNDAACEHLLCGNKRKALAEVKPHLMAEDADSAGSGAVFLTDSLIENTLYKV